MYLLIDKFKLILKQALCTHESREAKGYKISEYEYIFFPWYCQDCGKFLQFDVRLGNSEITIMKIK